MFYQILQLYFCLTINVFVSLIKCFHFVGMMMRRSFGLDAILDVRSLMSVIHMSLMMMLMCKYDSFTSLLHLIFLNEKMIFESIDLFLALGRAWVR